MGTRADFYVGNSPDAEVFHVWFRRKFKRGVYKGIVQPEFSIIRDMLGGRGDYYYAYLSDSGMYR